jgi:hypothetical protein
MKITAEINDYSEPAKTHIRVHNHWKNGGMVELEVNGERYTVKGSELISAINRCMLNTFGE